jgi:hypothetical protein
MVLNSDFTVSGLVASPQGFSRILKQSRTSRQQLTESAWVRLLAQFEEEGEAAQCCCLTFPLRLQWYATYLNESFLRR